MTAVELLEFGGIARAVAWRRTVATRLDDLTEWMVHLAERGVLLGREIEQAGELLATGQAIAAGERGGSGA